MFISPAVLQLQGTQLSPALWWWYPSLQFSQCRPSVFLWQFIQYSSPR